VPQALLLNTTTFCNARCPFCIVMDILDRPEMNMTDEQVEAALVRARNEGATDVGYSGGEPSIDPRILQIVARAKALGFTHQSMNTNGIKFRSAEFCRQLVEAGITSIDFSIHGHTDELHDELVAKKGALAAIREGCGHLRELAKEHRFHLSGTIVIARRNHQYLREISEFLHSLGITHVRLKYAYEGNMSHDQIIQQVAPYQDVVPSIQAALDYLAGQRGGFHVTHIPLCLLGEHAAFSQDFERRPAIMAFSKSTVYGEAAQYFRKDGDACTRCAVANLCTRLDGGYEKFHGRPNLAPFESHADIEAMFERALAKFPGSKNRITRMRDIWRTNRDAAAPVSLESEAVARHPGTPVKLTVKRDKAAAGG
jgi:pyruvate-formate lyase-activating enzyme